MSDHKTKSGNSEIINNTVSLTQGNKQIFYITELDDEFVAIDYGADSNNPKIIPLDNITYQQETEKGLTLEDEPSPRLNPAVSEKKPQSSKILVAGMGLGLVMALGANYIFSNLSQPEPVATSPENTVIPQATPRSITVVEVTSNPIERTLEASGTVHAYELIPAMTPATGLQINKILAEEGNFVNKGQVLAQLNDSTLQAELIQAKAAVRQAEANLAELRAGARAEEIARAREQVIGAQASLSQAESDLDLVKKRLRRNQALETEGAISRDRLDEVSNQERISQANVEQAKARLEEAKQQLAELRAGERPEVIAKAQAQVLEAQGRLQYIQAQIRDTLVTAPASGIVARRNAKLGEITSPSETLFSIIENGKLELRLKVPETLISAISPQQKVYILDDNFETSSIMGTVREIEPIIDGDSRQATVKVDLPTELDFLKPGMFLRAEIATSQTQGNTVPIKALLPQTDGTALAFVVQPNNTVKAQSVEMGEILPNNQVEVLSGLESGDRIVLKGVAYLQDGDFVKIID